MRSFRESFLARLSRTHHERNDGGRLHSATVQMPH
jgi:hypothetical protein